LKNKTFLSLINFKNTSLVLYLFKMKIKKSISKFFGKLIIKFFGLKVAYYLKLYFIDFKKMKLFLKEEKNKGQVQFPKKVAIIGIMTDKYVKYFPKYYESIKRYFLTDTPKHFYSFTDQLEFPYFKGKKDITIIPTEHRPMPWTMLLTFHHMHKIINELKEYSHIIYIDTDTYFAMPVTEKDFFIFKEPAITATAQSLSVLIISFSSLIAGGQMTGKYLLSKSKFIKLTLISVTFPVMLSVISFVFIPSLA